MSASPRRAIIYFSETPAFPIGKLLSEHHDHTVIYNRGIGGFVSRELLEAIDVCILDLKPARLFINIGTNDLSDSTILSPQLMENYDDLCEGTRLEITAGFHGERAALLSKYIRAKRQVSYSRGATAFIRQPVSFTRSFSLRSVSRETCLHLAAVA